MGSRTTASQRETVHVDHSNGGAGHLLRERLIDGDELGEHCGLFGKITLEEDCEIGFHEHRGDAEAYYLLSGIGEYDDNGVKMEVGAGDVLYCPEGTGHSIRNIGSEPLVFIALILKS